MVETYRLLGKGDAQKLIRFVRDAAEKARKTQADWEAAVRDIPDAHQ